MQQCIHDLIIVIFMSLSLVSGITMLVGTIFFRYKFRKFELMARYTLGFLLIYSVVVRFLILLPMNFSFARPASIGFDILYVALCVFFNLNIIVRLIKNGQTDEDK